MLPSVTYIREWHRLGLEKEATHMLVAQDHVDNDYYPVYVRLGDTEESVRKGLNDKVVEVFSLAIDLEEQLLLRSENDN